MHLYGPWAGSLATLSNCATGWTAPPGHLAQLSGKSALTHVGTYDLPATSSAMAAAAVLQATRIKLSSSSTNQSYESVYDCVLPDTASQAEVYSQVRQCGPSLLSGYNNTLMA
jgi:hypothetical protein